MSSLSHASAQGLRAEQQDRWLSARIETSDLRGDLLAVIDGHGGHQAADLIVQQLGTAFHTALEHSKGDIPHAVLSTFHQLDQATRQEVSGTTLSLVFVTADNSEAFVGILGDSPVAILDSEGRLRISPLHNVRSNREERAAAIARGGQYIEGYIQDRERPEEGLQLSRTLGDCKLARILNREPDIFSVKLNTASFVLLATDGVLDAFDHETETQIRRLADLVKKGENADAIVQDALKRQTGDNVTVLVWRAS